MPRKILPPQALYPYHVAGRCINKDWFKIPIDEVWTIMGDQLYFCHHAFGVKIHAFVLMTNHFHLIISTPNSNLPEAMSFFMRETSREITRRAERINQTWGGPFFRCILKSNSHFLNAYKYIYRNPLSAGLARYCEEYRYSTLRGLMGIEHLIILVEYDSFLFTPSLSLDHLNWLNTVNGDDEIEVKRALRKSTFAFQKRDKKPCRAEDFIF